MYDMKIESIFLLLLGLSLELHIKYKPDKNVNEKSI